jgi:hypothetical protein
MFFPERIQSIRAFDRVLEIGPGSSPHPGPGIFLEKPFVNQADAFAQRGYVTNGADLPQAIHYEGGDSPFHGNNGR